MRKLVNFLFLLISTVYCDSNCTLLQGLSSVKPYPSLTQCYKYNNEACCVSAHDTIITNAYSSLLSAACFRSFPLLELYYCFGCHPNQPSFTDSSKMQIRICKSFADQIWNTDPTVYDSCGFLYTDSNNSPYALIPSRAYNNVTANLPPLFSQYQVAVVEDSQGSCFTSFGKRLNLSIISIIITLYKEGDDVTVWIFKLGPYHNPQEVYKYSDLPFCVPPQIEPHTKSSGLGEILAGVEYFNSGYAIKFRQNIDMKELCSSKLDLDGVLEMNYAIANHYWFQMQVDDLPIWGFIGQIAADADIIEELESHQDGSPHEVADGNLYLYTHFVLNFKYNGDQIIDVSIDSKNLVKVEANTEIPMYYSVNWQDTEVKFEDRFEKYLDYDFFEHQIHWFSIFNSFMMVVFLVSLVALILVRALRKDYAKYSRDEEDLDSLDRGMGDDSGWKQIHGDVFRKPEQAELYAACIGTGVQLALLALLIIFVSIVGDLYLDSGSTVTAFIVAYALTSFVSGYVSGGIYQSFFFPIKSPGWIKNLIITATLFPAVIFGTCFMLNFISIAYETQGAIPFGTMVVMLTIWGLVSFPLTVAGTLLGRNWNGKSDAVCRINPLPRPIPLPKWYTTPSFIILFSGILPFGCIFIEVYFIFTSFWNYKIYYVYGFMLLVFLIVTIVTVCVSIVGTYFLLNAENYHWHWTCFFSGASTSLYVFLYSVYYFFSKTNMSGFLQTCFYFGYMGLLSFALAILTGTIGNRGTAYFVKTIYKNIKVD